MRVRIVHGQHECVMIALNRACALTRPVCVPSVFCACSHPLLFPCKVSAAHGIQADKGSAVRRQRVLILFTTDALYHTFILPHIF